MAQMSIIVITPDNYSTIRKIKKFITLSEFAKAAPMIRHGGIFNATYRAQLQHFAACINENKTPECTLEDGRCAIEIALAALDAISYDKIVQMNHNA